MKIIIHIGTHKTGTSSIQQFLAINRKALLKIGIFYPLSYYSPKNLNIIGKRLYHNQLEEPIELIKHAVNCADNNNIGKVLISAESLYAIMWFFGVLYHDFNGDYWEAETKMVRRFQSILPSAEAKIFCFFRRQDLFAESIYNQLVKNPNGLSDSFQNFLPVMREVLNYKRHINCWEQVFGSENIIVRTYSPDREDVIEQFMREALNINDLSGFKKLKKKINERLCPDVLEYKRIFNKKKKKEYEALLDARAFTHLSKNKIWCKYFDNLMSYDQRVKLLRQYESGNRYIAWRYMGSKKDGKILLAPPNNKTNETQYSGLTDDTADKIKIMHKDYMKSNKIRAELCLRKAIDYLKTRSRSVDLALWPIRSLWYRIFKG